MEDHNLFTSFLSLMFSNTIETWPPLNKPENLSHLLKTFFFGCGSSTLHWYFW